MSETNGQVSEHAVADVLMEEITRGYLPTIPLEALWAGGSDVPQITMRRDIEFMQMHPVVSIAIEYYKSGIAGAEFWGGPDHNNPDNDKGIPISPDARVAQFALAHAERFWQRGVPLMQEAYIYGWAPGEHVYKDYDGMLVWSHLKGFHPNDGFILTLAPTDYRPIGTRVKNIRGKEPVDMWFASERVPAKAAWYAHRPRFGQHYGRSQLMGAWRPWRRLGWRDAVEQVIDAAVYRAGYNGPEVRYPPGHSAPTARQGIPATQVDGGGQPRRENRDAARQIIEWAKAGAGVALSSENYAPAQGGGEKWSVKWPDHVMDVGPLIAAAQYLEDQIMLGIGVPPELVKAGGTGSGYSGRSIPREAFLDGQQKIADAMLQMFVEQVLRPLVLWNFGDVPFSLQCKSLLKSQASDKQGDEAQGGNKNGGGQAGPAKQSPPPPQPAPQPPPQPTAPPPAAMSLEVNSKVLDIVRRVLKRVA